MVFRWIQLWLTESSSPLLHLQQKTAMVHKFYPVLHAPVITELGISVRQSQLLRALSVPSPSNMMHCVWLKGSQQTESGAIWELVGLQNEGLAHRNGVRGAGSRRVGLGAKFQRA